MIANVLNRILDWWQSLEAQQRRALRLGASFGLVLVVVFGLVVPLWRAHAAVDASIQTRIEKLGEMVLLERQSLEQRQGGFRKPRGHGLGSETPISFIEGLADQNGIKEKLTNIKPGPTDVRGSNRYGVVSFQMQELTMVQLTDFLFQLEKGGYDVRILSFAAEKKARKQELVDINLEVELLL